WTGSNVPPKTPMRMRDTLKRGRCRLRFDHSSEWTRPASTSATNALVPASAHRVRCDCGQGKEIETMSTPQTTSAATDIGTNGVKGPFPADVVAFAAANQVEDCLQPLLEATHRLFPTARFVKVQIDDDPEIRDLRHILYNVQVAGLSLDQSRAAD